jgi:hypothetical protein
LFALHGGHIAGQADITDGDAAFQDGALHRHIEVAQAVAARQAVQQFFLVRLVQEMAGQANHGQQCQNDAETTPQAQPDPEVCNSHSPSPSLREAAPP